MDVLDYGEVILRYNILILYEPINVVVQGLTYCIHTNDQFSCFLVNTDHHKPNTSM